MNAFLRDTPARATGLYLLLTVVVTAVFKGLNFWSIHCGGFESGLLVFAVMWCPALAALLTCRLLHRRIRSLAWHWPKGKYMVLAYFLPLAYSSIAYGILWLLGLGEWNSEFASETVRTFALQGLPRWGSLGVYIGLAATVGVIRSVALALGEEIGWRGFLVPELAKQMPFTRLSLLSGLIWAGWHVPDMLFLDFAPEVNRLYMLFGFSIMTISVGFIFNWVTLKSGSLWPAALLHGCQNLFVQGILDPFTHDTGRNLWFSRELGIALAPVCVAFAIYFWRRRSEITVASDASTADGLAHQEVQAAQYQHAVRIG